MYVAVFRADADRDVFNEKPSKEELMAATQVSGGGGGVFEMHIKTSLYMDKTILLSSIYMSPFGSKRWMDLIIIYVTLAQLLI